MQSAPSPSTTKPGPEEQSRLHEFLSDDRSPLQQEVRAILAGAANLTDEERDALCCALGMQGREEQAYGAGFDFIDEIETQMQAVRAMRSHCLDESHRLREGVSIRELRETITASNTLLGTLIKTHEKVLNHDRLRAIETATVAAIRTLPKEIQEAFFQALQTELEAIA